MFCKRLVPFFLAVFLLPAVAGTEETHHGRGNWLAEHGPQAGRPTADCSDCHAPSYCSDCHNSRQDGLTPETRMPEQTEREFIHRGEFRSRHAGEARTDPAQCQQCHLSQECQSCHAREGITTGAAAYPHPAGWLAPGSPEFHGDVARQDILLCASCHENGSATNCVTCHSASATTTSPHPAGWGNNQDRNSPACRNCH